MFLLSPKPLKWVGLLLLLISNPLLRALDGPTSFVLNLPFPVGETTPAWLGPPETPVTSFARMDLPISPPTSEAMLLVTVYFQEKEGGFLRLSWKGAEGAAHLLSDNFYEGIGMSNQRSLLVSPDLLQNKGALTFQSGDTTLGIQRIKLEWLVSKTGLTSPEVEDILVTPSTQPTQLAQNFDGQPKPAGSAAWHDQLVTVPIADQPQRIEQGVEFSVELDAVPRSGRLVLKEAGLIWKKRLVVWVNQHRAGTISPAVPDLKDEGYPADKSGPYVGWRGGSLFLPVSLLHAGTNTVQFSAENDTPAAPSGSESGSPAPAQPLAVKDVILQLDYPAIVTDKPSMAPSRTFPPPILMPVNSDETLLPNPGEMAKP